MSSPPLSWLRTDVFVLRSFRRLWFARVVSVLGTQVTLVALPLTAVVQLHATAAQVGLLSTASSLPYICFGLVLGPWIDGTRRRPMLIATDAGRAIVLAIVPVAAWRGWLSLGPLLAIAFLVGTLSIVSYVAQQSYVPSLIGGRNLTAANSRLEASNTVGSTAGPGLAGFLVQLLSAPLAIAVDSASYVASALCIWSIDHSEQRPAGNRRGLVKDLVAGISFLSGSEILRPIVLTTALGNVANAVRNALIIVYAVRQLDLVPAMIGLLLSVAGCASFLGAAAAEPIARRIGLNVILLLTMPLAGVGVLLLAVAPPAGPLTVAVVSASQAVIGFVQPVYNVNQLTARQVLTPPELQARVHASFTAVAWGSIPIGAAGGSVLASLLGLREAMLCAAAVLAVAGAPILLSRVRDLRSLAADA